VRVWLLQSFALLALFYFAFLNLAYALLSYLGLKAVQEHAQSASPLMLKDFLEHGSYEPVSILVPAYNEEASISAAVRSYLNLRYPEFEVIVISDGSDDGTVARLIREFDLVEVPHVYRQRLTTARVRRVLRSPHRPGLLVIDKERGGKADALNAGLELARYGLVCAVDADSLVDAEALLQVSRHFAEDESLIAAGGTIRPLAAAALLEGSDGAVPKGWLARLQIVEYTRAFLLGRLGWSRLDSLIIISGAFGLFRHGAVMQAGGYRVGIVGEDVELVVRLHKHFCQRNLPYRMLFVPEPICWTVVPERFGELRRQRNRWQRGLWETLWLHRDMLFNPRYGKVGTVALPYFWLFEGLAPIVEGLGYLFLILALVFGLVFSEFALLFLLLTVVYGMMLSQLAIGVETLLFGRYRRLGDRLKLLLAIPLEALGYRQLLVLERFLATFQVISRRGDWGRMPRRR
jgi:cellulose synthase/poly-beta-1,6-N-acetylglucosamine synthase-like glycosyltransferase